MEREIIIEGIWDTRPSPIVRMVYLLIASEKPSPCCVIPMIRPPTMLMIVIIKPAVASPFTYLDAPSMAPKNADSCWILSLLRMASLSSIAPDERSASIAICFPGIASNVKRAVTSDTRSEPLLITIICTMISTIKTIAPMTRLPPPTNEPNTSTTLPGLPVDRISRVEDTFRDIRNTVVKSSSVGNPDIFSVSLVNRQLNTIINDKEILNKISQSSMVLGIGIIRNTTAASR